ncbi:DUF2630 family protein [Micrococcaceae bacterium Sec5.7]
MNDQDILQRITELVQEEHDLRDGSKADDGGAGTGGERLRRLEESLDQCWDLLRQRRAKKESGENPNEATERPVKEVEGYRQ